MRVSEPGGGSSGEVSVSDGNSVLNHVDLNSGASIEKSRLNNQTIAKELNDLKNKGYELISSNGDLGRTNYIFVKKSKPMIPKPHL